MPDNSSMSLLELVRPVGCIAPISKVASAVANGAYISLKSINKLGILIFVGNGTGTFNVTLNQATAVAGTGVKALAFTQAIVSTSNSTVDAFSKVVVAGNSLPLIAGQIAMIDIDPMKLDINNDFDCLQVVVTESGGANPQLVSVVYLEKSPKVGSISAAPSALLD